MLPPVLMPILLIYASFFSLEFLHLFPTFEFPCCLFHASLHSNFSACELCPRAHTTAFLLAFHTLGPKYSIHRPSAHLPPHQPTPPVKSQELCTYLAGAKTEVFPNLSNSSRISGQTALILPLNTHHNTYILQSKKSYCYLHAVHGWYSGSRLGHQHPETAWQGTWVLLARAQKVSSRMCFHKP